MAWMTRLHDGKCSVYCSGDVVPDLVFTDDTTLVASDEDGLRKSLDFLVAWCGECVCV